MSKTVGPGNADIRPLGEAPPVGDANEVGEASAEPEAIEEAEVERPRTSASNMIEATAMRARVEADLRGDLGIDQAAATVSSVPQFVRRSRQAVDAVICIAGDVALSINEARAVVSRIVRGLMRVPDVVDRPSQAV